MLGMEDGVCCIERLFSRTALEDWNIKISSPTAYPQQPVIERGNWDRDCVTVNT